MKEEIKWRERDEHGSEGGIWRELFFYLQDDETFHMKFKNFQLTTLCSSCRLVRHTKKNNEYERSESIKAENGFWGFMQACNMLKEKTFTRQNAARCFLMCSLMDFLLLTVSDENSSLLMCVEIFSRELSERKTSNDGVYAWSEIWSENYDEIFGLFYWDYDSFWEFWGFCLIWRNLVNFTRG